MVTLRWERKTAGRWLLKAPDGQIWAAVVPYRGYRAKGQFRATCLHPEISAHSRREYGSNWWVLGLGVAAAKRRIMAFIERQSFDDFQVAA